MNRRRILGIIIIMVSIVISAGLFSSSEENIENKGDKKTESSNPFFEFSQENKKDILVIKEEDKTNLTELMANSYLEEIKEKNPEGIDNENKQIKVPSLNTIDLDTKKVGDEAINIFDKDKFSTEDINISKTKSEKDYLEEILEISENNFDKFDGNVLEAVDNFISYQDKTSLKKYVVAASDQVSDLLEIKTPESLLKIHLDLLNLWYKKTIIFNSLLETDNDPLKAVFALEKIPDIINKSQEIDLKLSEKFEENNI